MPTRPLLAMTLALAALASAPARAADPKFFKSPPCSTGGQLCAEIYRYVGGEEAIHSLTVTTPAEGKLLVSVTGSMQCINQASGTGNIGVTDLTGKIVRRGEIVSAVTENATPFPMRLAPRTTAYDPSAAVNLANSRLFNVKKGSLTFDYWLVKNRVDEGAFCNVFDVNFTATYLP